jgi:hypothetical protein
LALCVVFRGVDMEDTVTRVKSVEYVLCMPYKTKKWSEIFIKRH